MVTVSRAGLGSAHALVVHLFTTRAREFDSVGYRPAPYDQQALG